MQPLSLKINIVYIELEDSATYGGILLALVEGWCPSATWEGPLTGKIVGQKLLYKALWPLAT